MDACVKWSGYVRKTDGYGITRKNGKNAYAHRVAIGAKPGEVVMHSCDNPSCVNPSHLSIGTYKKNSEDMVAKGRSARGSRQGAAKLDEETIPFIRAYRGFLSSAETGKIFGVSDKTIINIWNNRSWRHV